jgi:FMN phosphatase YigB (HAD superfamily)
MSDLKACRAVVFDAYGTLFNVSAPARSLLGERGDALSDLWRRKQLGFMVVWLDRLGSPEDRLPGRPAAGITSLSELPALLGATP